MQISENLGINFAKLVTIPKKRDSSFIFSGTFVSEIFVTRSRYDLILVYKILNGFIDVDNDFFSFATYTGTRGHKMKLTIHHNRLDIRKYSFSQRVVPVWNSLPESCISASSLRLFKGMVDIYLQKEDYT